MNKKAAIVIIGNEILSGQTVDCNSLFFTKELRELGVSVYHIEIIPDNVDDIADSLRRLSDKYDYVFTSGGIGPTHDDVTIEGIAKGFGVKVVQNKELKEIIKQHFKDKANEAAMKMSEVPEGTELIKDKKLKFPLIMYRNIFIFPGIPEFLQTKFEVIREKFREKPFYTRTLLIRQIESNIAGILKETETKFKNIRIGSYPIIGNDNLHVKITIESKDEELVDKALTYMRSKIDPSTIIKAG